MIDSKKLLSALQKHVPQLEEDLRARCDGNADVDRPLQVEYEAAKRKGRTALTYSAWRDEELTQVAVAWVLASVFVRFLEDNELIETPYLAGPGSRLQRAKDEHEMFFRKHPTLTEREYFEKVFTEVGTLPAMKEFFDRKHNPLWQVAPSGDAAKELLDFWRKTDPDTGALAHDFTDPDWNTRFLGDLYQDLSEAAQKKFALLQTPDFVEEFILDRTLTPAIQTFGYQVVRMIDPTCGSGHFLLGGFQRLFRLWQEHQPGANPRVLAQKALDGIYGVDLNPYAVAIARFRLLLVALKVCSVKRLRDAPDFQIHLAVGDSLLHGPEPGIQMDKATLRLRIESSNGTYQTEDPDALAAILSQHYHAVVGNPPYIIARDPALNRAYRDQFRSCFKQYSLSAPFFERFFDLSIRGEIAQDRKAAFVGKITSNAFMKRDFGKKLVEECMLSWDITHVIDTSGAYIPGHGTPTVIVLGRNQRPASPHIRTVLGINGEPKAPENPASGVVWSAIINQIDRPNSESKWVSSLDSERSKFFRHPWSIGGGGVAELKDVIDGAADKVAADYCQCIGYTGQTNMDEAMVSDAPAFRRKAIDEQHFKQLVIGDNVRDWGIEETEFVLYPYCGGALVPIRSAFPLFRWLWPSKTVLGSRRTFGKRTYIEEGRPWWGWHQISLARVTTQPVVAFASVSTHSHFSCSNASRLFNRSAPAFFLDSGNPEIAAVIAGLFNSSTGCFWIKQVSHCKGSTVDDKGARQSTVPWEDFYAIDGSKLYNLPIPNVLGKTLFLEIQRRQEAYEFVENSLAKAKGNFTDVLDQAKKNSFNSRRALITLQEELDWQCYRLYGLIEVSDNLEWPEDRLDKLPPLNLGERAFEIVMARQMEAGELETTWFERHKHAGSKPITQLPDHWPNDYRALVERRFDAIEKIKDINLIERPEYKRRWNTEPWEKMQEEALRKWLLARLEGYFSGGSRVCDLLDGFDPAALGFAAAIRPHFVSTNQLAEVVNNDTKFLEVAELYHGSAGFSVAKMIGELIEDESVSFLPVHRYKDSGLRKRRDWEATWELQRKEDAVEAEVRRQYPKEEEERLKDLIRKAQQEKVGDVPAPPKYATADFKKPAFWKLRGKLDVPKERWISYPGAERDGDPSPLIAWAGWDQLQQAQALAEYYLDARNNQGWPEKKLKMLLAGLLDLLPWAETVAQQVGPRLRNGPRRLFRRIPQRGVPSARPDDRCD
jgi:hypothetical protein